MYFSDRLIDGIVGTLPPDVPEAEAPIVAVEVANPHPIHAVLPQNVAFSSPIFPLK